MSYHNIDTGSRHFLSSGFQASSICLLIHIASLGKDLVYSGCYYCRGWSSYQAQLSSQAKQGYPIQLPSSTSLHILAMGRGGREATLWAVQNDFLDKIMVISCLETNLTRWYMRISEQNTASKVLWIGFRTLCEYKLRKMVRKSCCSGTYLGITPTLKPISKMAPCYVLNIKIVYWTLYKGTKPPRTFPWLKFLATSFSGLWQGGTKIYETNFHAGCRCILSSISFSF